MKTVFLYDGPHPAHAAWAESIGSIFVSNTLSGLRIPNLSRLLKTFAVLKDIPAGTDLLLCESGAEIPAGALWKRRNPDKKLVLIVDDPKLFFLPKMAPPKRWMYHWALPYYDLFIPTSRFMQGCIPPEHRDRSAVIPLFVEDKYRFSDPADLNKRNIIFVGRVGMEKGVDRIIEAYRMVQKDFPESRLYIVGDGPLKKPLERKNRDVVFTGMLDEPLEALRKGSLYMNLARVEPFGIAILEAMCLGLVPIVTPQVGLAEDVKAVSPELIVEGPTQGAEMVRRLWGDPQLLKELSSRGRKVAKKFTKEKSLESFRETIRPHLGL